MNPEVYRFVPQGLATGIYSVSMQQKRAIPYGTAPSEASRRSGRTSALPYPPLLALLFYHDSPLSSTVANSIVLDMGSTLLCLSLSGNYGPTVRLRCHSALSQSPFSILLIFDWLKPIIAPSCSWLQPRFRRSSLIRAPIIFLTTSRSILLLK